MHDLHTHPLRSDPFRIYIRTKATKYIREKKTLYFRGRTIKSHNHSQGYEIGAINRSL